MGHFSTLVFGNFVEYGHRLLPFAKN